MEHHRGNRHVSARGRWGIRAELAQKGQMDPGSKPTPPGPEPENMLLTLECDLRARGLKRGWFHSF